ncbi:DUF3592 domain-containing protein [Streptomyces sp. NPDC020965]|uniref:DUF3592 domain-containing protein n=1 Tax=Streptomyces sp. NPDC020965 TaxID=3365105 RepID=UPI00379F1920
MPLEAIAHVESADGRSVRIRISGGDGQLFRVRGRPEAARAFTGVLERALAGVRHVPEGAARVTMVVRPWTVPIPSPRTRRVMALTGLFLVLPAVGLMTGSPGQRAGVVLSTLASPAGAALLALSWKFFLRDPWILWRRGVIVPGTVVDYRTSTKQQAMYPVYRFTLVNGDIRRESSSVSVLMRHRDPRVDVVYDPHDPSRVRGGRAVAHMTAGLALGVLGGLILVPSLVALVNIALGGLLPG